MGWSRIKGAVKKYTGIDFDEIKDTEEAKKIADEKEVHYEERHKKGDILNLFFEEFVEEHLKALPTFHSSKGFDFWNSVESR